MIDPAVIQTKEQLELFIEQAIEYVGGPTEPKDAARTMFYFGAMLGQLHRDEWITDDEMTAYMERMADLLLPT